MLRKRGDYYQATCLPHLGCRASQIQLKSLRVLSLAVQRSCWLVKPVVQFVSDMVSYHLQQYRDVKATVKKKEGIYKDSNVAPTQL